LGPRSTGSKLNTEPLRKADPMRSLALITCFLAVSGARAEALRVATVDMSLLFKQYPGTAEAQKQLDDWAQEKKQDLAESQEDLMNLQEELKNPPKALSRKEKRSKQEELDRESQDYMEEKQRLQDELASRNQEMTEAIAEKIRVVVAEVAQKEGFNLVLDSADTCYARSGADLTEEVLRAFSKGLAP